MEQIRTKELLMKIAKGDEPAFVALYEETRKDIFAFALSILKNYYDAEDVMHDVFVRKKKKYYIGQELVKDKINSNKENIATEYSIFISELFDELKEEERQIVVLHLISDLTHKTIAKILELPLTTVKWRYRKAILHLEKISVKKEWEL